MGLPAPVDQAVERGYGALLARARELAGHEDDALDLVQEAISQLYGRIASGDFAYHGDREVIRWCRYRMWGLAVNLRTRYPVLVHAH